MLKPKVKAREFERFGFKRCKGIPKESECYYLCIARGCKMLFASDVCFAVNDWDKNDPRIHKKANCRYRDNRTALDIIYELIKTDMLKSEWEIEEQSIAFDTQKVVKELEDLKMRYFLTLANTGDADKDCAYLNTANAIDRAIEIVKRGGRDEE
jgi:hypothetical protein